MDLGTMTKKLKTLTYKSKDEFVADLNLIWDNCLKYNAELLHPLRRNAIQMRKEAEKLVPLIPDLTIRPRAEVEAEERRKQNGGEDDAGDDSDDEPIMSSRGRIAGAKGSTKARKTASGREEGTPGVDQKPILQLNGLLGNLHEGSDAGMDGSQNGFATPPIGAPGSITPAHGILGSQTDGMDLDGPSINGMSLGQGLASEDLNEDEEYKIWKQVTKKDRALVAKERNKLFKGDRLNPDEPALLRSRRKTKKALEILARLKLKRRKLWLKEWKGKRRVSCLTIITLSPPFQISPKGFNGLRMQMAMLWTELKIVSGLFLQVTLQLPRALW
jgi:transcriptional activator SPT7